MKKNKKIWDYFIDNVEYPRNVAHNPIPYGTVWNYISDTFLNGFINYIKPIECYLIDRYTPDNEDISDRCVSYRNKNTYEWLSFKGTKGGLKELILSDKIEMYHTKLSCFGDDIIILGEIETNDENEELGLYMFFWYNMDCSDCSIGKFQTEDTKEEVVQSIINWLEECKSENKNNIIHENIDNGIINYTKLPLSFIGGWIKF